MDYKEEYEAMVKRCRELHEYGNALTKQQMVIVCPQLKESEDERARKWLYDFVHNCPNETFEFYGGVGKKAVLAYLEKQKENIEKEYVFRPLAGTDINSAALQAIRKADEGDRLVLAFNGAYIPVRKGCNANKIVDIYDAFIEKQKEPHYTMRNALFDKCVENCDPEVMKKVSDEVDEILEKEKQKEQKPESCDCSRDEESYTNGIHHVLMNPEAYGLIKQKPAEWSEEDKHCIHQLILFCENCMQQDSEAIRCATWLKSLRPQSHWKPSEEQMKALEYFIRSWGESGTMSPQNTILCAANSLYSDLKKLL